MVHVIHTCNFRETNQGWCEDDNLINPNELRTNGIATQLSLKTLKSEQTALRNSLAELNSSELGNIVRAKGSKFSSSTTFYLAWLRFAKDHKDWTKEDWRSSSKVIFSDESNFQLCPTHGRLMVRRRPGEAYRPQCLAPIMKFGGGSVMIWGCFSKAGIGQICLCEGRMNQARCEVVLEENLLPFALTMFPNSDECFFHQDNAPCHTARSVKV